MAALWFSDLELEEPSFFHQWQGDCFDQFREQQIAVAFGQNQNQNQDLRQSISYESNTNATPLKLCAPVNVPERPLKVEKATSWDSGITEQSSSSATILSFGARDVATKVHAGFYGGLSGGVKQPKEVEMALPGIVGNVGGNNKRSYDAMMGGEGMRKAGNNTGSNQEHILAERKRREKLSQRFIALSKIVPGLKKMDKASVLGDAIKYLKQLQDKVQDLETQATKRTVESAVIVKKSHLLSEEDDDADNNSSCDENFNNQGSVSKGLPEIEAKMSERTVLIKIHCENRKGVLVKVLAEIEALGLTITSSNVMPFASSSLDITAMAQVEEEFSLSVKDVVKKLNQAFKKFM